MTVSFWALCTTSTSLKIGINFEQYFGTGGSPSAQVNGAGQATPALTETWTRYSLRFAIPSTSGKTLGTNGDDTISLNLWFSAGSDNSSSQAGGIGVQSGNPMIWGVQLEVNSSATALETIDPREDLANCQRFLQWSAYPNYTVGAASGAGNPGLYFVIDNVTGLNLTIPLSQTMRAVPTVTSYDGEGDAGELDENNSGWASGGAGSDIGAIYGSTPSFFSVSFPASDGITPIVFDILASAEI